MGRPKGGKNRSWTKEQKYKIVQEVLKGEQSSLSISKKHQVSNGMVSHWIHLFKAGGIEALSNKKKPGNPLAKYRNRKELTELEQKEYLILQLQIENERLKKGYLVKGGGKEKVFVSSNNTNSKSSKP